MKPRTGSFSALGPHGLHRVVYSDWGALDNPRVLICVHGLTRNGCDFDSLAEALAGDYRVICPDIAGRGRSDWLKVKEDYGYPLYCADMGALMAHLNATEVHWVGTSMGGLIGMLLGAVAGTPITRLVVNDIGPFIPRAALERIVAYVGNDPRFESRAVLEAYLREIYAPFGALTDRQWSTLVVSTARQTAERDIALHYDPGIVEPLRALPIEDVDLWSIWDALRCPVLVLRGGNSDVLLAATAREMTGRGPGAEVVTLPGIGHAPLLMDEEQIERVRTWLLR